MARVRHPHRCSSREQNQSRLDTEGTRQGGRGAPQAGVWSHTAEPSKQVSFRTLNFVLHGSAAIIQCPSCHLEQEQQGKA